MANCGCSIQCVTKPIITRGDHDDRAYNTKRVIAMEFMMLIIGIYLKLAIEG